MIQNTDSIIALDMGSSMTKVLCPQSGALFMGDSFAAKDMRGDFIEAADINGLCSFLNPGFTVLRPIISGEITDTETAGAHLYNVFGHMELLKKRGAYQAVIAVKKDITEMQRQAFLNTARSVGIRDVAFLNTVLAAAIGAGENIEGAEAHLIADIGADKTEVATIAFSDTVSYCASRTGGNVMNRAVIDMIFKKYGVIAGSHTAEIVKKSGGDTCSVCGKSRVTGTPVTVEVEKSDINAAIAGCYADIADAVISVIADTPAELMSDIIKNGITLTGGGALSFGLKEAIEKATGLNTSVADEPSFAVVNGAGAAAGKIFGASEHYSRRLLA